MERWARRAGRDPREIKRSTDKTFILPISKKVRAGDCVFVCSLSDFFNERVPDEWRDEAMALMALRQDVRFLLLTKRPKRMAVYCADLIAGRRTIAGKIARLDHHHLLGVQAGMFAARWTKRPTNVMVGVTVENQARAAERIPQLLSIQWPGKSFVSIEPMLGQVDLSIIDCPDAKNLLSWVICGGESGPGCRPMDLDWARLIRDDCRASKVAFFMKQLGGWPDKRDLIADLPEKLRVREVPE